MDDLIENYQEQIEKLKGFGLKYIDYLNCNGSLIKLSEIAKFEKGFEVGSINYISKDSENYVRYLRVGDLISQSNPTFISKENAANIAHESDILIAFDGAPGRTAFGLKGAFSSGIYKINSDFINKGLIYFELISKMNQKTINDHSQGTTILHAAKSIPFLQCIDCHKNFFNDIFKRMVYLKQAINILEMQKNFLLDKYFTNLL
ncbi:MAG: hypothetical protein SOZ83_03150 [Sphaerochaetaceae bacterium]|nr:hypothetical protein [Sphaerochaetaceae bacterium]